MTGAEQCDDGNTTGGDGCSATCRNESSGPVCGDGVISGTEECDDTNTMSGDGCSATCETEGGVDCGNGMLDANEDCDDNNATADDGCTGCNVDSGWTCNNAEPSVCTMNVAPDGSCQAPFPVTLTNNNGTLEGMAMGDTTGGSSHVAVGACDGEDSGAGNDIVYTFTTTEIRDVLIELNDDSPFDAIVRVTTAACMINTEVIEYFGGDGCSDQFGTVGEYLAYPAMAPGTYFVHVDGYDATEAGAFTLMITASATTCGDGVVDALEFCDDDNTIDGDGCSSHCDEEPGYDCDNSADPSVCVLLCGDGFIDQGEECDDDGNANADGCSATCTLEYDVLEAEPNDVTPQAINAVNQVIKGSLDEDDIDLYTFTLTSPAKIEIETYATIDAANTYGGVGANPAYDCDDGEDFLADTVVNVFAQGVDVSNPALALFGDDDDGDERCSYVGTRDSDVDDVDDVADPTQGTLPAGTYTIKVVGFNGLPWPRYLMNIRFAYAPVATSLAINEYLANDGVVDSNCDTLGTTTSNTDDEFVEIVNKSNVTVDLTGLTIQDGAATTPIRHTFTSTNEGTGSLFLDPNKAIVIWGGGEPACAGVTNWFIASSGSLALNNTNAESISVKAGATTLATVAFNGTTAGVSSNLDVDITGATYMLHNAVAGHVGDFSPGKKSNNTPF